MNLTSWAIQGLLALVFAASGVLKASWSVERLVSSGQTGVEGLPVPLVRFIGLSELLGAAGLVLPRATGVLPVLTPLAAVGLGIIMVLAAIVHARRREVRNVVVNVVILSLCLIVGWATLLDDQVRTHRLMLIRNRLDGHASLLGLANAEHI